MADILDYLTWRGDLTLEQDPFNEVDNLILAELSYLDFSGLIPLPGGQKKGIPLTEVAEGFFRRYPKGKRLELGVVLPGELSILLSRVAECPRFQDARLNCYLDLLDHERGEQFSALTVETGDGQIYCAYRGTDDTLAGWKEDLEMACVSEVPAQKRALDYLKLVARQYPRRRIRLGGHSKGGNLAVYAGVFCPLLVQRRITAIWSNDGPGFHRDVLDLPQHQRLADRIHTIVPRSSVVGMLLEHEERYDVVDSDQLGLWQHDGMSWQVSGPGFVKLKEVGEQALAGSREVQKLVFGMTVEQRGRFVDALFDVLAASGARTLTELKEDSFRSIGPMVKALKGLDRETREGLLDFIQLMFKLNARMVLEDIQGQAARHLPAGRRKNEESDG